MFLIAFFDHPVRCRAYLGLGWIWMAGVLHVCAYVRSTPHCPARAIFAPQMDRFSFTFYRSVCRAGENRFGYKTSREAVGCSREHLLSDEGYGLCRPFPPSGALSGSAGWARARSLGFLVRWVLSGHVADCRQAHDREDRRSCRQPAASCERTGEGRDGGGGVQEAINLALGSRV